MKKTFFMVPLILIILVIGLILWQESERTTYAQKYCEPDEEKTKVAVVIAKGGIYDTDRMSSQVSEYYSSVKKDLNIDNGGLKNLTAQQ